MNVVVVVVVVVGVVVAPAAAADDDGDDEEGEGMRAAQIQGALSPRGLNFVDWPLIFSV